MPRSANACAIPLPIPPPPPVMKAVFPSRFMIRSRSWGYGLCRSAAPVSRRFRYAHVRPAERMLGLKIALQLECQRNVREAQNQIHQPPFGLIQLAQGLRVL